MSFIVGLLFFVLFVVLTIALFVVVFVLRGINSIRRLFHIGGDRQQSASSSRQQAPYRQTRTADGVTITDQRSPDEVNKKIFSPDEGEYVEYSEN